MITESLSSVKQGGETESGLDGRTAIRPVNLLTKTPAWLTQIDIRRGMGRNVGVEEPSVGAIREGFPSWSGKESPA